MWKASELLTLTMMASWRSVYHDFLHIVPFVEVGDVGRYKND